MNEVVRPQLRFDEFELDEANALLTREGRPVQLPPKAFALLCVLARHAGMLTRKDDLLDAVWGHRHVSESVLKTTISQLRAALSDDAAHPKYIETASRLGYRFIGRIGPVSTAALASGPAASSASLAAIPPAVPAEDAPARAPPPQMIGRRAALARLHEAWKRASAGRRELFWIAGDPGIGKTTLIETFVDDLKPRAVAYGQCVEQYGAGEPYLPVLEALGSLCRRFPELPPMMRAIAPTWLLQLPWLTTEAERAALHRELAGTNQERMVRELTELIGRFTQREPLLFVTEDLHWVDLATLRLMSRFTRVHSPTRVLWLGSFRLTQVVAGDHPLQELRQELRLHQLCTEVLLDPFSEQEVAEYVGSRLPDTVVPEAFARRLHAHTDGLPMFVANVVDTLLAQDGNRASARDWLDGSATAALPVPESLTGALEKQIARLPAEAAAVLGAASVCGMEFQATTVADVLERDPGFVGERCDELVRHQQWIRHVAVIDLPDGTIDARYAFQHALYKHAFYRRLGMAQRVQCHRRVALSLERSRAAGQPVTATELASHHELGHQFPAALRNYAEAAQGALNVFAPAEAINLTGRALDLLPRCPEGTERNELELALVGPRSVALALLHGVASVEARETCERARTLCDLLPQTPPRALALNALGWVYYTRGEYANALALAQRLHSISVSHDDPLLFVFACNLMGVTFGVQGKHAAACEWLERGLERCAQLADRPLHAALVVDPEVSMRANVAIPLMHRGLVDQARSQATGAFTRSERIGQPIARMLAHWTAGMLAVRLGNPESVAAHAAALGKIVASAILAQGEGPSLWLRGWAEARLGEPRAGHQHVLEGYARHARFGMYAGCTEVLGYAAEALILNGDWAEAERQVDEALQLGERIGERAMIPSLLAQRARIALGRGDSAAARTLLDESAKEARAQGALWYELRALIALAELDDRSARDLEALQAAYANLREGADTEVCARARALLTAHTQ